MLEGNLNGSYNVEPKIYFLEMDGELRVLFPLDIGNIHCCCKNHKSIRKVSIQDSVSGLTISLAM